MDYGLVEIGNIAAKASSDDICKLKFILEQHRIYHIVDGVTFFHPHAKTARSRVIQRGRIRKVDITEDRLHHRKNHQSTHSKFRELIVPDLYKLNYTSLIFLDSEEAEFLAKLIYKAQ